CAIPQFDLVVCDEAHRTTGAKTGDADESSFVKIHDNNQIRAAKRLYMTATPRVYSSALQESAKQSDVLLCSMDNEEQYGPVLHYLPFGSAVDQGLLSDYKVIIFAVSDHDALVKTAHTRVLSEIAKRRTTKAEVNKEDIPLDEIAQMIGCWRALAKNRAAGSVEHSDDFKNDPEPMKRAVAFLGKIAKSIEFADVFETVAETMIEDANAKNTEEGQRRIELEASGELDFHATHAQAHELDVDYTDAEDSQHAQSPLRLAVEHVDGTFSGKKRQERLNWLREEVPGVCHVLSNVRCLSEGVDVPNLDAAIFMTPRNSEVDVIQAVGRVMRKAEGKKYGYIILPIAITPDVDPVKALDNNQRYRVVWQTLNAIRAHDERFRIMINQMQVNEKPDRIIVKTPQSQSTTTGESEKTAQYVQERIQFGENKLDNAIYATAVKRCGDREYLEDWATKVAEQTQTRRELIEARLQNPTIEQSTAINSLVQTLKENVNPNLGEKDALDLLNQHLTTLPIFEALFEHNDFMRANPVAQVLNQVAGAFNTALTPEEHRQEERLKNEVKHSIDGVTSAQGRLSVIHKLYEKFFKKALPDVAEKLGVVYTPVEVVDYILHSIDYVLRQEFKRALTDTDVHILDPFTGTGSFISQLLLSGLIQDKDIKRKYEHELHANELMLLAYYIAAVSIEETYRGILKDKNIPISSNDKISFPGIVYTDTFQTTEAQQYISQTFTPINLVNNSKRRRRQNQTPIEVIIGNPPYSVGQKSANDFNQNEKYETLDKHVKETYVAKAKTTNKNSLYDSYIKAFRWASDRLEKSQGGAGRGVIAFVSNGAFIDNIAMEGFRKCLAEEFSTIYVFNLRGNARTSGELRRKEKDNVFGQGTRTNIAITILVKNPSATEKKIYYHDIGDYLTREQKLGIIAACGSVEHTPWEEITPNEKGDWINQRGGAFYEFFGLGGKKERKADAVTFFLPFYGRGVETGRDAWTYNFSRANLIANMSRTIDFYNKQVTSYRQACSTGGGYRL
ncbi:MAG: helicase-related protein, partial [Planctomycetia bacterium]|nr:helicase-related protein [Planctomycetia bacterium]